MGELIIRANISLIEDMEERAWLVEHIACFAATPIDERFDTDLKDYAMIGVEE